MSKTLRTLNQIAVRLGRESILLDIERRNRFFDHMLRLPELEAPPPGQPYSLQLTSRPWQARRGRTAPC